MKKVLSVTLLLTASILGYFITPYNIHSTPASTISETTYLVTRIIDGDTVEILYNSEKEKVRLIGIDTPETVKPDTPVEPFGKEASDFTKSTLLDKYVSLEFDEQERDRYGRLLAYLYIEGEMFNEILLEEGLAHVSTFPPNTKYVDTFIETESTAKNNKVGMWENYDNLN
jgi:micrococcal nuclease